MVRNYLKIFLRNTLKDPFYSGINIIGLSVGLACSIVAFLYIVNEFSYNGGFEDYDKIYRIGAGLENEMEKDSMPYTLYEVAPALIEQVPEIESATRFVRWYSNSLIKAKNEYYPDIYGLISDSSMLDVFSFKILQGDPNTFLKSPTKIAITESLARKIFKNKNALNEFITFEGVELEVAWVMEDPKNSMIDFDLIVNFEFLEELKDWLRLDVYTFFKLRNNLSRGTEAKIRKVSDKIILDNFSGWTEKTNSPIQAFKDIYLKSNLGYEIGKVGSVRTLYIFGFLAGIILLIAIVNYINLLTSRSEHRNREVGIRKVVGADKSVLKIQFLGESILLAFFSLLVAFVIAEFFIYLVNGKLGLELSLFRQTNVGIFCLYLLVSVIIGILSGIYPAFVMAKYSPLKAIKGIFDSTGKSDLLKKILVIIQFSISTFLIIAILVFNSQIRFMKTKDLGFNKNNLLVLTKCTKKLHRNIENIRQDLISYHNITNASSSQSYPGTGRSGQAIRKASDDPKKVIGIEENRVQDFYTETMGIEIVKGRPFDPEFDDDKSIIINETTAKLLNVDDPVGLEVVTNRESVIIGIMKDYHYYPINYKITPLYLSNYRESFNNIVVRINPEDKLGTIKYIKSVVMKYDPDYYWNYFFIDNLLASQYKVEDRLFAMIFWGSGIALILSILGLFALTSYTISRKFKEVGIRKTFGATVNHIIYKLNMSIIKWVLLTNIVAWPLAYYVMKNWLQNYPYKIEIKPMFFLIAALISLLVALVTISFQAIKAARMNPVDAIRYE